MKCMNFFNAIEKNAIIGTVREFVHGQQWGNL